MKTTITVSVRNGWLTSRAWRGDAAEQPRTIAAQVSHIAAVWPGPSVNGVPVTSIRLSADTVGSASISFLGFHAAEVVSLIEARHGEMMREIDE